MRKNHIEGRESIDFGGKMGSGQADYPFMYKEKWHVDVPTKENFSLFSQGPAFAKSETTKDVIPQKEKEQEKKTVSFAPERLQEVRPA